MKKTSQLFQSANSTDLPDIKVWLALADTRNVNHALARQYWDEQAERKIAFCRISMMGLLRLSTHPKVMAGDAFTHAEAWNIYHTFRALPEVTFLSEPAELDLWFSDLTNSPATPHHLWTDAYLAALALTAGCRIVSFDSDFKRFPELPFLHLKSS